MVDIIGRAAELAALQETIVRSESAPPGLVLHGDPGVGKSVLLEGAATRARDRGMRVLWAAGSRGEQDLPFGGLHQLLAPLTGLLPRIEPFQQDVLRRTLGLQDGPEPRDGLAVPVASLALLAAAAQDAPVLVAVDDTQWIDPASREVLTFLLLRLHLRDLRALLVRDALTSDEDVPPGIVTREVRPLSHAASATLLHRLGPALPQRTRRRVLRDADGNPLALAQLAEAAGTDPGAPTAQTAQTAASVAAPASASASGERTPRPAAESPLPGALPPPGTRLEREHAERVRSLPGDLRGSLLLTALGDEDLALPSPAVPTAEGLRTLKACGLVTRDSTPTGLRFRHPLVRSAVVRSAAPEELRAAHRVLAERHRGEPERRLRHLAAAATAPDEETAAELERTAHTVTLRGGTGRAVTALRDAAALSPAPASAARRMRRAAELAAHAGRFDTARDLLHGHSGHPGNSEDHTGPRAVEARILLLRDGDLPAARRLLAEATSDRPHPDPDELERALRLRVTTASYAQDPAEWRGIGQAMSGLPGARGTHVRLLHDVLGDVARTGHGARARLRTAFARLPHDALPDRVAELCGAAAVLDVLHDYRDHVRDLIRRETGPGAVTCAAAGHWLAAHDHTLSGDWPAAEASAGAGLELCLRHGLQPLAHSLRCALGLLAAGRGDVAGARAHSAAAEQWAAPRGSGSHLTLAARNLALAALSEGDYETAYAQATRISPPGTLAPHVTCAPWSVLDLVDAAVHTGRSEEARAHVAAAERAGIARLTPRLHLHLLAARALTSTAEEDGAALLRAALAVPRGEYWPFEHARIRLALGELQRRRKQPTQARSELRRAADVFARTGATAWRRRAEQELRAAGVSVGARGCARGPGPSDGGDAGGSEPAARRGAEAGRRHAERPEAAVRVTASGRRGTGGLHGAGAHRDGRENTASGRPPPDHGLTAQQLEVAHLAASGLSNKEIARRLHLSPRTVGAHLYRIFPKLGITSRSALRDALGAADGTTDGRPDGTPDRTPDGRPYARHREAQQRRRAVK